MIIETETSLAINATCYQIIDRMERFAKALHLNFKDIIRKVVNEYRLKR